MWSGGPTFCALASTSQGRGPDAEVAEDWHDSLAVLAALRERPAEARAIAAQGQRLAFTALSAKAVDCYWWHLLATAAEVLPQPVEPLPEHARPLEDVLLWSEGVVLSADTAGPLGGEPPQLVRPPADLQDPTCFRDGALQGAWGRCCNSEAFGLYGDMECWLESGVQRADLAGRPVSFDRCCLSGGT